jgi:hypothetical protein
MLSLPPQDGVDARICADINAGALTVSAVNRLTHVVGTSLLLPPTGEHDAIGSPSGIFLLPPCALREHGGGKSPHAAARSLVWVDGTLACYHRGGNVIAKLGPSFLADSVFSHPPSTNNWGGAPPWRHAVLWNTVNSVWHSPCLNAQDLLMQIHG